MGAGKEEGNLGSTKRKGGIQKKIYASKIEKGKVDSFWKKIMNE